MAAMTSASRLAPEIIPLPDGELAVVEPTSDAGLLLTLTGTGHRAEFHGIFAQRLMQAMTGASSPEHQSMLHALFQPWLATHPWLATLAKAIPRRTGVCPDALILGTGLGMLFVEVTDRCNERCVHCYAEAAPERANRLSLTDIEHVLRAACKLGDPAVQFTGGDPLIHPDIVEAVALARNMGFGTIEIYTNGLALGADMLARLAPYQPRLAFSVYARAPAVHDAITRVPGSLKRTLRAMRRARETGFAVRASVIVMPENRGLEGDTIRMLQQDIGLDADDIGLDVVRSAGRGRFMQGYQPDTGALDAGHRPAGRDEHDAPDPRRRGKLCVAANGDVHPCIFSRAITLGNIRQTPLDAIVRNPRTRPHMAPSAARWESCRRGLSCADCQAIAYALGAGDASGESPSLGARHAAA